jgi:AcrR family transcriptional regulator
MDEKKIKIFQATLDVLYEKGLAKLTFEDVAKKAKVSRQTLYKYFPYGKDQLLAEVVSFEAFNWLKDLAEHIDLIEDFESKTVEAVMYAHRSLKEHKVLNKILSSEPEKIMPLLAQEGIRVVTFVELYVVNQLLARGLLTRVKAELAAEYIARMLISIVTSPGSWDLSDPAQVRTVVRGEILSPVLMEYKDTKNVL